MHSCHSLLVAQRRINNVWTKPRSLPRRLYLPAAVQTLVPLPSSCPLVYHPSFLLSSGAPPHRPPLLPVSLVKFGCLCSFCTSSCPIYLFSPPYSLPSFLPSLLRRTGLLLHLCPPTSPPPISRQRALPFSRPPSLLASIFPTAAPPSPYLSRHCRRAPSVPQTLFSTIKLLSLPLPGNCKNNLG